MAPLTTWELRWFLPGEPGEAICDLLGLRDSPVAARTDRYLILPEVTDMGIKIREGRLEIKGRLEVLGPVSLGGRARGRLERWSKWSYAGVGVEGSLLERFAGGGATVAVTKERALRKLAIDGRATEEVPLDRPLERGLLRELTRVVVGRERHWTVAVEGFPGDDEMRARLESEASAWLGEASLPLHGCLSYPAWLASLLPSLG